MRAQARQKEAYMALRKGQRFLHKGGSFTSVFRLALANRKEDARALELRACSALNLHQCKPEGRAVKSLRKEGRDTCL